MNRTLALCLLAPWLLSCQRQPQPAATKEQPEAPSSNLITMEEPAQQRVGLKTAPAAESALHEFLPVTGTVQPVDQRVGLVRSTGRGRLLEVRVKVGDRVKAGDTLALLDHLEAGELSAQLASAEAELRRTQVLLAAQARQSDRARQLASIGAVPRKDAELAEAEQAAMAESVKAQESLAAGLRARLRRLGADRPDGSATIRAPFAGIVTKAPASAGLLVDASEELFTVADLSLVWVQAEVYEKDLARLRVGEHARISVESWPNERFPGRVSYIGDVLDPQTRTVKVRCEVPNPAGRLKLDMFGRVELPTTFEKRALTVPEAAIQQLDGKTVVFVRHSATTFETRPVEAGRTVDGLVEIRHGLRPGEPVVVAAAFHLKSILAGKDLGEE